VVGQFGVSPRSIPDYLALVGDRSDGLPGIPRWGKTSTAAVLTRYGHIEDIPLDAAAWDVDVRGAAGLVASLRARHREALLYRNLSILRTDVPLPDTLEHIEWHGADRDASVALAERLDVPDVLERIPAWAA